MKILSIDSWGNNDDGYEWNNCFTIGEIDSMPETDQGIIDQLIKQGILNDNVTLNDVYVMDDQYNIVICDKSTNEPLYAIEYCNEE